MCMEKKKQLLLLRVCVCALYAVTGVAALFFETSGMGGGWLAGGGAPGAASMGEYVATLSAVCATMVLVPLALKLMSLKPVRASWLSGGSAAERNYVRWSLVRLALLFLVIFPNVCLYYMLWDSSFGCCALIGVLASLFCWPSQERWARETEPVAPDEESKKECQS